MQKINTHLMTLTSLLILTACGNGQPDNVGTSKDIVVNNREAVMASSIETQEVKLESGPVMGGGNIVTEDQTIDKNPPVEPVVSEKQKISKPVAQ